MKKLLAWAVVVFIGYYLLVKPTTASSSVHSLLNVLKEAGAHIARFLNSL